MARILKQPRAGSQQQTLQPGAWMAQVGDGHEEELTEAHLSQRRELAALWVADSQVCVGAGDGGWKKSALQGQDGESRSGSSASARNVPDEAKPPVGPGSRLWSAGPQPRQRFSRIGLTPSVSDPSTHPHTLSSLTPDEHRPSFPSLTLLGNPREGNWSHRQRKGIVHSHTARLAES